MLDFMNPRTSFVYGEYLDTISSSIKRQMIKDMIDSASNIFTQINTSYRISFQMPIIKININSNISAEGMDGIIYISEGLINHCLSMEYALQSEITGENKNLIESLEHNHIAKMMLTWVFAHEFFHITRMHNKFLEKVGSSTEILKAIEHDADLCGIAEIYRLLQNRYGSITNDLELRKLTLYSVFWIIRSLPNDNISQTHLPLEERLIHMHLKMCIVRESKLSLPVDINCERPETIERVIPLINVWGCPR